MHTDSSALFDWEMFSLNERLALQDGRVLDARREARGYARRNKLTKSNQDFSETGPWFTEFTPTWKITSCICTLGVVCVARRLSLRKSCPEHKVCASLHSWV